jgi:competence protein ComEC
MRTGTLAFLFGIWLLQQQADLPDSTWGWALLLVIPAGLLLKPYWHLPAWLVAGYLWSLVVAAPVLNQTLPAELEGQDLLVEGRVISLPVSRKHRVRFEFDIQQAKFKGKLVSLPDRVRLSWYGKPPVLVPGESWRLRIRLKRPHGFMNPGGFDYEAWLFQHRIRATGYVRNDAVNRRVTAAQGYLVQRWRLRIREHLRTVLPAATAGMMLALVTGDRSAITPAQWRVMRRTGTTHLMAISGLHIGLVAGLAFFAGQALWRFSRRGLLWLPAPKAGAILALVAAVMYAALAGFSIPTQRALIMVAVVMLALLSSRPVSPSRILALALLLVLILDPLAVLAAGFWLSFGAVAIIFYGLAGRLGKLSRWQQAIRVQWGIAFGLFPLLILFFQQISLVAPLANLVAVPVVGLLVVPLALLGTFLLVPTPVVGTGLLNFASAMLGIVFQGLERLGESPFAQVNIANSSPLTVLLAGCGVLLILLPRGMSGRWLGVILLLPLLLADPPQPAEGEAWLTLLDVGQGLSAVVQTRHHTLVFDTGPRFDENFDAGRAVVVPFLRHAGVSKIDMLILSHGDSDHVGGADSLLATYPVRRILSSVSDTLPDQPVEQCQRGQQMVWEGVRIRVLHPEMIPARLHNDASCVLQVTAGDQTLLLTGDIEKPAELALLRQIPEQLAATVLVAPHHGSNTSSTAAFIRAVAPDLVLFPVGYRNRYHFPDSRVLARYDTPGVAHLDTAGSGAIRVRLGRGDLSPRPYRLTAQRYWHDR